MASFGRKKIELVENDAFNETYFIFVLRKYHSMI